MNHLYVQEEVSLKKEEKEHQKEQEMLEHAAFLVELSEYVQMLHFMAY